MKKSINLLVFMSAVLISCAQDVAQSMVPSVVLNAFQQKFPGAKDVEWEIERGYYNVEFEIGFNDHEAWIDSTGKIVKHQQEISKGDLPSDVKETIKRDFSAYCIDDVKRIEEGIIITYKVELENRPEERVVVFSVEGKVLENREDD